MLECGENANGYKWIQKYIQSGNYIVPIYYLVTCLILPE